jgi:hypothetical protein
LKSPCDLEYGRSPQLRAGTWAQSALFQFPKVIDRAVHDVARARLQSVQPVDRSSPPKYGTTHFMRARGVCKK